MATEVEPPSSSAVARRDPAGAAGAGKPESFDRRLLAPMMLGAILNPVNSSIIAVALAPIGAAFGAPASQTAWLISALYLATAIGQPLVGRLVDTFGPKRLFLVGAALTGAAGVLGMLAPGIWVLVAARVVLGFGTCAGYPAAMYIIRAEAARTGMRSPAGVLTTLSITTQTVAVIGPTLGGLLINVGGWRSTLAINIPLGLAAFVLGWLFLPASPAAGDDRPATRASFDWAGIVLFVATLLSLLLVLMEPSASRLWLLGVTAACGAGFAVRERRRAEPFLDVRVFSGNIPLLLTYARALLASIVSYSFVYGYTQWLEDGRGLNASAAGLILLPAFAVGIAVAAVTGRRAVVRGKLIVGAAGQVAACALLLALGPGSPYWLLVLVMVVLGIPQGLVSLANQNALYFQARPALMGASSGLLRTFMYLGAMIASSAAGAFFGRRATTQGLHELAVFLLVSAVIFLSMALFDRSLTRVGAVRQAGTGEDQEDGA
jgi:MFS family permease